MNYRQIINNYIPSDKTEQKDKEKMLYYIDKYQDKVLYREVEDAHFTASVWIVSEAFDKVLLCYHNIYQSYSWLGGHADGIEDLSEVALKEAKEESGINDFTFVKNDPISIEILPVPEHIKKGKKVKKHEHLNVTYLLQTSLENKLTIKKDENQDLKWFYLDDVNKVVQEEEMKPIYEKLNNIVKKLKK